MNHFTSNLIILKDNLTLVFNLVMPPKIAYLALEIIVAAFPSLSPLFCMSLDILIRLPSELDSKYISSRVLSDRRCQLAPKRRSDTRTNVT